MGFAQVLKELMNTQGVSNYALAKYLKCSQSTIKNWLSEANSPNNEKLQQVAEYFGVSVDYLLGNSDIKEKPASESTDGLSDYDIRILSWFRSLPPEKKEAILNLGDGPKE